MTQPWIRVTRWGMAVTMLGAMLGTAAVGAQAEGWYTSVPLGYTITWDAASWQSNRLETTETSDILSLSDDNSAVVFIGRNDGSDAQGTVESFGKSLEDDSRLADVELMEDCPEGARVLPSVTACYTYLRPGDGELVAETALLEAWDLGDGVRLLLVATVADTLFASYLPKWASFDILPASESATPVAKPLAINRSFADAA